MRTNIDIDDALLNEAMELTGLTTKKATVEEGLRRLIYLQRQSRALESMRGAFPDIGDDYKRMRDLPPLDDREQAAE